MLPTFNIYSVPSSGICFNSMTKDYRSLTSGCFGIGGTTDNTFAYSDIPFDPQGTVIFSGPNGANRVTFPAETNLVSVNCGSIIGASVDSTGNATGITSFGFGFAPPGVTGSHIVNQMCDYN